MRQELVDLLTLYVEGEKSLDDCYEWFSGLDWEDGELATDPGLRRAIGRLELLATEAVEGLRAEADFGQECFAAIERFGIKFLLATEDSTLILVLDSLAALSTASAPVVPALVVAPSRPSYTVKA
jgi:hypothetical protein